MIVVFRGWESHKIFIFMQAKWRDLSVKKYRVIKREMHSLGVGFNGSVERKTMDWVLGIKGDGRAGAS